MIIVRYLNKQILFASAAVAFLLTVVVVMGRLLKHLDLASRGELDTSVLLLLLSYRMPEFVQMILPMALLMGILLTYGRMYAENEMTVLVACGISKKRLLGMTMISSTLVLLLEAFLVIIVTPWGLVNTMTLLEAQKNLSEFDVMVPGIFLNISRGARTTYSEIIEGREMHNVFMYERASNRVVVAQTVTLSGDAENGRFVMFNQGSLNQGVSGKEGYNLTTFGEFGIRIPKRDIKFNINLAENAMSTKELIASSEIYPRAELQWRISLLLTLPILTLLAVSLSKVNSRQGKFAKLIPAILLYILYSGLLLGSRSMMEDGIIPSAIGLWWVHVAFLGFGLMLFFEKIPHLSELSFFRRKRKPLSMSDC